MISFLLRELRDWIRAAVWFVGMILFAFLAGAVVGAFIGGVKWMAGG